MESINSGLNGNNNRLNRHYPDLTDDTTDGQVSDDDDDGDADADGDADDIDNEQMGSSCGDSVDNMKLSSPVGDNVGGGADEDLDSLNRSLSSPGCFSGLSSLQSPSTSLASPLNLLASPATPAAPAPAPAISISAAAAVSNLPKLSTTTTTTTTTTTAAPPTLTTKFADYAHLPQQQLLAPQLAATSTTALEVLASTDPLRSVMQQLPTSCVSSSSCSGSPSSSNSSNTPLLKHHMMRTFFSSSPAILLGNRFSHLAMGFCNNSNNEQISPNPGNTSNNVSISQDPQSQQLSSLPTTATTSSAAVDFYAAAAVAAAAAAALPLPATLDTSSYHTLNCQTASIAMPPGHVITPNVQQQQQRNPIGANPRDINNPLSVNQLTKRDKENTVTPDPKDVEEKLLSSQKNTQLLRFYQKNQQQHQQQQQQSVNFLQQHHQEQHMLNQQQFMQPTVAATTTTATTTQHTAVTIHTNSNDRLHHHNLGAAPEKLQRLATQKALPATAAAALTVASLQLPSAFVQSKAIPTTTTGEQANYDNGVISVT